MSIDTLLDEIEEIVAGGSSIPFASKVMVDKNELLELIREIRVKLPEELKQAEWIKEERQRILAEAEKESEILRQEADRRIKSMIDESEVTKRANEQAKDIISAAQQDAKKIRLGARAYADDILVELSARVEKVLAIINSNREELKNYKS